MARYLYSELASLLLARQNCLTQFKATGIDNGWFDRNSQRIEEIVHEYMPSGSGFDNGTELVFDMSTPERLVFHTAFHHMDENGYYCGWSTHTVIVRSSLAFGVTLRVEGRNMRGIKDHIHETFLQALMTEVTE